MKKSVAQTVESARIYRKRPFSRRLDSLRHTTVRFFYRHKVLTS